MGYKSKVYDLCMISFFTAIIVVCTFVTIPMPSGVPITLQTFGVALSAYILQSKKATISVAVYIAIGAIGLPVFSGMSGGLWKLIGLTGGFIFGFLFLAFIGGLFSNKNALIRISFGVLGLLACHLLGVVQYSLISGVDFISSVMLLTVPYIGKDVVSVVAAFGVSKALNYTLEKANLIKSS